MFVNIYMEGIEYFVPHQEVDVVFISLPYFNSEYNSNELTQSHIKFLPNRCLQTLFDVFFGGTIKTTSKVIKKNGHMLININSCNFHFKECSKFI